MKRIFKIVGWSIFFGILLIFAIALAMNGFSVEKLTQAIKRNDIQQTTEVQTPDFDAIVDEFLANELGSGDTKNEINAGENQTGMDTLDRLDQVSGSQVNGASVQDFTGDLVEKDVRSQKDLLLQLRLEHYQSWKKEKLGEMEDRGTGNMEEVHESAAELTQEDNNMLDALDNSIETEDETKMISEAEKKGYNDLPDIEFSEGPIGRIEEE